MKKSEIETLVKAMPPEEQRKYYSMQGSRRMGWWGGVIFVALAAGTTYYAYENSKTDIASLKTEFTKQCAAMKDMEDTSALKPGDFIAKAMFQERLDPDKCLQKGLEITDKNRNFTWGIAGFCGLMFLGYSGYWVRSRRKESAILEHAKASQQPKP